MNNLRKLKSNYKAIEKNGFVSEKENKFDYKGKYVNEHIQIF